MKLEEYIESIFGCLERIENKINGLSVPLPEGNSPTVNNKQDESVLNEVRNGHETFRKLLARVYEGLAAIKNDMVSMDRKNSTQKVFVKYNSLNNNIINTYLLLLGDRMGTKNDIQNAKMNKCIYRFLSSLSIGVNYVLGRGCYFLILF